MSELTSCNYCSLRNIKRRAAQKNLKVTLLDNRDGGLDVYVHAADIAIKKPTGDEDGERSQYRQAWFMALTDHCVC